MNLIVYTQTCQTDGCVGWYELAELQAAPLPNRHAGIMAVFPQQTRNAFLSGTEMSATTTQIQKVPDIQTRPPFQLCQHLH